MKKYFLFALGLITLLVIAGCAETTIKAPEKTEEEMKAPSFADIIIAKRGTPHKLTYTYSTSGFKPKDVSGKVSVYNSYPKERIDGTYKFEGKWVESRIYIDGDDYTLCTQQQEWQCFTISLNQFIGHASPGITAIKVIMEAEEESVCKWNCSSECEFTYSGTRDIGGETAHCWDTTNKKTSRTFYVCWTSNGILLYAKVDNGDNIVTIETEEFSTDVTDSDFVPPAESISVSDMIKEGTGIDIGDIDIGNLPGNIPGIG